MTVYRRREGVVSRQVAGSTVLVALGITTDNPQTRAVELFTLNKTGSMLWDMLGAPQTEEILSSRLVDTHQIPATDARADVQAFLGDLVEIGAVEACESP